MVYELPKLVGADVLSLVCLIVVQLGIGILCYDTDGPALQPVVRWVLAKKERAQAVVANVRGLAESLRVEPTVEIWVMLNVGISVHHALGALLAFLAYLSGSVALFRIGLSFEIGEDVLHYLQMVHALLCPPGAQPFRSFPKIMWAFIAFHHVLGLVGGTFAYLYLANWSDVQLLVTLLLFAPVAPSISLPLQVITDLSKPSSYSRWNGVIQFFSFIFTLWTRFYVFVPLAFSLVHRVDMQFGHLAGHILMIPLLLFFAFSTVSVVMSVPSLVAACRTQDVGEQLDFIERISSGQTTFGIVRSFDMSPVAFGQPLLPSDQP